ncbi:MAG: transcription-repair coupling factor [Pseudomonadota bacterium]|nr:transcription-repair coupling factor [Pseudomonadota bacterium]
MSFNIVIPKASHITHYNLDAGSADAALLAELANKHHPVVVFCASSLQAQRLKEEIAWFSPILVVQLLPDWETLPYDQFSPYQDLISERLGTLYEASRNRCDVLLVPASTALYKLPPSNWLAAHTFFLKSGERIDIDALRNQMVFAGYSHVTQVIKPGEFSVRGGLIDLYPMGSSVPYRLDLFDDTLESIRTFDVDTQRTIYPVKEIRMLPAKEFPLDEAGITRFRQNWRTRFEGDPSRSQLYKDVSAGLAPLGIEYYLPLFFEETGTIFDYFPKHSLICLHEDIPEALQNFWQETQTRYNFLCHDPLRPILPPDEIFLRADALFGSIKTYSRVSIERENEPQDKMQAAPLPDLHIDRRSQDPLRLLRQFIKSFDGRILILAESLGRRETIHQMFAEHGLNFPICTSLEEWNKQTAPVQIGIGPLTAGFIFKSSKQAFITESELYSTQIRQTRRHDAQKRSNSEGIIRDLSELRINDPVVHEAHGIGRFLGLKNLDMGEGEAEFLIIEYAGEDKLYVPVSQLEVISRYSGATPENAPLHRLGSGQWEKARQRTIKQVHDTATELLELYAKRAARQGHAFKVDLGEYEVFASRFEFEETPDQNAAINAVIADMQSGRPMDRLVCGDVGFGKTEVAMRAAFLALLGGRQVAVLVPTTLLAEQHFQNFSDRLSDWPIHIAELSRFKTSREIKEALEGLANGHIDLVIGTHRLIQKDVRFKKLGLVIIDEEHRFGVMQKERLKALRAEVDVLTLTATPIPRTLSMSLEGLRDFSVISTAPQKRLSIKTFALSYSEGIIREAIIRELKRGGQIYFLHNEVDTIVHMREKLEKIVPEARISTAHGQMPERELEHVMRDFYQRRFNILLCTTIIETGIDIPTANTIIINRADRFGLAQLHQLRGRVGRSHHQAYAYLLVNDIQTLTRQAKQRLDAIQIMEDLGAGFHLAMHDMEIRGAGELLGDSQSGNIQEVGFTLYMDMLGRAVRALRDGEILDDKEPIHPITEINLHLPALLPADYCEDIHERLVIYKRLANCETHDAIDSIHEELIDRFGLPPIPARTFIEMHRLRIKAQQLGIIKIDAATEQIDLQFLPNPPIEPIQIIELIQNNHSYRLNGQNRLKIIKSTANLAERVKAIQEAFHALD